LTVEFIGYSGPVGRIFIDTCSPQEYQLVGRDITELKEIEAALRASEEKSTALINAIPDPILRISQQGIFVDLWCKKGQGIFVPADLIGKNITEFFLPDVAALMMEYVNKTLLEGVSQIFQFDSKLEEGVRHQEARLVHAGGREVLVILRDITKINTLEQNLQFLSIHDNLTGLYNRAYFAEEMRRLESGRSNPVGVVMCDVDGLKSVNDSLGYGAGDELLKTASMVILQAFRGNDAVARIGGDEFAILLPNATEALVAKACDRLRVAIAEYNNSKPKLPLSISIGAAVSGQDGPNLGDVLKQADEAMYSDKFSKRRAVRESLVQEKSGGTN